MPRLHSHYSHNVNKEPSTWWLRSGNFLRFKNLEIGYNLPKTFLRKLRLDAVRVYCWAQPLRLGRHQVLGPRTGQPQPGYELSHVAHLLRWESK